MFAFDWMQCAGPHPVEASTTPDCSTGIGALRFDSNGVTECASQTELITEYILDQVSVKSPIAICRSREQIFSRTEHAVVSASLITKAIFTRDDIPYAILEATNSPRRFWFVQSGAAQVTPLKTYRHVQPRGFTLQRRLWQVTDIACHMKRSYVIVTKSPCRRYPVV